MVRLLAVDLGNESGRVVEVTFDGEQIRTETRHRFVNHPVFVHGTLYWDVLRLWYEIEQGLSAVEGAAGIGVASFGVDFGLLDGRGKLIENPVHMRDTRTEGMMDAVFDLVPAEDLFERTGVASHPINTLFQLAAIARDAKWQLKQARNLLTMPNLINYWLTGEMLSEFTHTTTTQCYAPTANDWDFDLLNTLDIPSYLFPEIVGPGEEIGTYNGTHVYTVGSHDTASAVIATPTETSDYAYISSGTWSLFGLQVPAPVTNEIAFSSGITNEGGYRHYRMLSMIMGMWIVQECRRAWREDDTLPDYAELFEVSGTAAFRSFIDPDDEVFFTPGDMPSRIREWCAATEQPVPERRDEVVRCVMESLALKYNLMLDKLVSAAGQPVDVIHVVGGGAQNTLLCQMTANATGRPVIAGPVEATALGNGLVQLIARGEIAGLAQAREVVRRSYDLKRYDPQHGDQWRAASARFGELLARKIGS